MIFLSKLLGQKLKKDFLRQTHLNSTIADMHIPAHTHVLRKLGGGAGFLKQHFEPLQP